MPHGSLALVFSTELRADTAMGDTEFNSVWRKATLEESFSALRPTAVAAAWSTDGGRTWRPVPLDAIRAVAITGAKRGAVSTPACGVGFEGEFEVPDLV